MTGFELKQILLDNHFVLQDVANKLGMSQPNFSKSLTVADIKTGLLERLCNALNLDMSFFYPSSAGHVSTSPVPNHAVYDSSDLEQEILSLKEKLAEKSDALEHVMRKYIELLEKQTAHNEMGISKTA